MTIPNITTIPAPRVPFIDGRTGLISREWYRFLLNLFMLSGSGQNNISLDDLLVGPPVQDLSSIDTQSAELINFNQADFIEAQKQFETLMIIPAGLESKLLEIQKQLEALESTPTVSNDPVNTGSSILYDNGPSGFGDVNAATLQGWAGKFYLPNLMSNHKNVLDEKCYTSNGWYSYILYGGGTTWSVAIDGPTGLIQSCLEVVATGIAGWRLTNETSAATIIATSLRAIPGDTYVVDCWYKLSASNMVVEVRFYDVAGAYISNSDSAAQYATVWTTFSHGYTVPANAAYMSIGVTAATTTMHFGLFNLTKTV